MGLRLNELSPAPGAKKKALRRGRGIGSGLGKTGGLDQVLVFLLVLKVVRCRFIVVYLSLASPVKWQ